MGVEHVAAQQGPRLVVGMRYSREMAEILLGGVVFMKESVTYQAILEEGEAKGMIAGARQLLIELGSDRFGPPDARTAATLDRIRDLQRLKELGVRLLRARNWQELLGSPPRRRGRQAETG
jgi:predicted transposase YdaD